MLPLPARAPPVTTPAPDDMADDEARPTQPTPLYNAQLQAPLAIDRWWHLANCAHIDARTPLDEDSDSARAYLRTDPFFPQRGETATVAKVLCAACPVRLHCLIDGMREPWGIWGGFTVEERAMMRRGVKAARSKRPGPGHRFARVQKLRLWQASTVVDDEGVEQPRYKVAQEAEEVEQWCIDCGYRPRPRERVVVQCSDPGSATYDPWSPPAKRNRATRA